MEEFPVTHDLQPVSRIDMALEGLPLTLDQIQSHALFMDNQVEKYRQ